MYVNLFRQSDFTDPQEQKQQLVAIVDDQHPWIYRSTKRNVHIINLFNSPISSNLGSVFDEYDI